MSLGTNYLVICVLCTVVAITYYRMTASKRSEEGLGALSIGIALVLFLAALKLFF